jgi:hypothetical protein
MPGAAFNGEMATSRPERANHRGGTMKLQPIVGVNGLRGSKKVRNQHNRGREENGNRQGAAEDSR